jgi:hypothetical protein
VTPRRQIGGWAERHGRLRWRLVASVHVEERPNERQNVLRTGQRRRVICADPPGKGHLVAFENGQEAPAKQTDRTALTSLLHGVVDRFSRPPPPENEISGPRKGR